MLFDQPKVSAPRRVLFLEQPRMRAVRVAAVRHGLVRIEVLQLCGFQMQMQTFQQTTSQTTYILQLEGVGGGDEEVEVPPLGCGVS